MSEAEAAETGPCCLRCAGITLTATDAAGEVTFWHCPSCDRAYTRHGQTLTERWGGPLSIALYGVIFDRNPQARAAGVLGNMRHFSPDRLDEMAAEIELELTHPTQPVRSIHGCLASEEDLREFLGLLAVEIRASRDSPSPPTDAVQHEPPAAGRQRRRWWQRWRSGS